MAPHCGGYGVVSAAVSGCCLSIIMALGAHPCKTLGAGGWPGPEGWPSPLLSHHPLPTPSPAQGPEWTSTADLRQGLQPGLSLGGVQASQGWSWPPPDPRSPQREGSCRLSWPPPGGAAAAGGAAPPGLRPPPGAGEGAAREGRGARPGLGVTAGRPVLPAPGSACPQAQGGERPLPDGHGGADSAVIGASRVGTTRLAPEAACVPAPPAARPAAAPTEAPPPPRRGLCVSLSQPGLPTPLSPWRFGQEPVAWGQFLVPLARRAVATGASASLAGDPPRSQGCSAGVQSLCS